MSNKPKPNFFQKNTTLLFLISGIISAVSLIGFTTNLVSIIVNQNVSVSQAKDVLGVQQEDFFTAEDYCYLLADNDRENSNWQVIILNGNKEEVLLPENTGVGGINTTEALEYIANEKKLYMVDRDRIGLVSLDTGKWEGFAKKIGTANGDQGSKKLDDINGLAYDVKNDILWGIDIDSKTPDPLFQLNRQTGQFIPNAFGDGIDYLSTKEDPISLEIDDIAVHPITGEIFGIPGIHGGSGIKNDLVKINPDTGDLTLIGNIGINDIEGLSFMPTGFLVGTAGNGSEYNDILFELDPNTAEPFLNTRIEIKKGQDIEAVACLLNTDYSQIPTEPTDPETDPKIPPIAEDDLAQTQPNQAVEIPIIENDSDQDGELQIETIEIISQPQNEVIEIIDGKLIYTPNTDFTGEENLEYTVCDNDELCSTASVKIIISDPVEKDENNRLEIPEQIDATEIQAKDDTAETEQNEPVKIDVTENDQVENIQEVTITNFPENGNVTINPDNIITYTPDPDFKGTDEFIYQICNQERDCDLAKTIVTVKPKGQVLGDFGSLVRSGGALNAFGLLGSTTVMIGSITGLYFFKKKTLKVDYRTSKNYPQNRFYN